MPSSVFRSYALLAALAATTAFVPVQAAHAVAFGYGDVTNGNALMSNFNLVTLGDYKGATSTANTAYNYVDGRVIVGGNFSSSNGSAFCRTNCAGNATTAVDTTGKMYGALTVFGSLTNTSNYVAAGYNSGGNIYVGGNSSANYYANGKNAINIAGTTSGTNIDKATTVTTATTYAGTFSNSTTTPTKVVASAATVFPFKSGNLISESKALSSGLAGLPGTPGVTAQKMTAGDGIFFQAYSDYTNVGKSYGVITTTIADLAGMTNFKGVDNGTNDATFVIVTGDGANYTLPNLGSYAGSNKVIFDFVDAKTLKFGGTWSGSILAPLATISSMGGTIDGSVIVNSIVQTQNIFSTNLFAGDLSGLVPEPASIALLGAGLAGAGLLRRRRK